MILNSSNVTQWERTISNFLTRLYCLLYKDTAITKTMYRALAIGHTSPIRVHPSHLRS